MFIDVAEAAGGGEMRKSPSRWIRVGCVDVAGDEGRLEIPNADGGGSPFHGDDAAVIGIEGGTVGTGSDGSAARSVISLRCHFGMREVGGQTLVDALRCAKGSVCGLVITVI